MSGFGAGASEEEETKWYIYPEVARAGLFSEFGGVDGACRQTRYALGHACLRNVSRLLRILHCTHWRFVQCMGCSAV